MAVYAPQPGPQTDFLACPADVVVYGGKAGGGKTWGMLLELVRNHDVPGFSGVVFRRKTPQIENPGGLWDTARPIIRAFGGEPRAKPTFDATFSSGARVQFSHLERESDVENWQGSQLAFIGFDEATHFTRRQILYMLSRNRSTSGVRPYMRMTCNPDPDSFVAELVDWYIDEPGYPDLKRCGVIRYFAADGDDLVWGATREEVADQVPHLLEDEDVSVEDVVLSFTFIPSSLDDNPALLKADPGYRAKLKGLPYVDRMRLEKGNWRVRASAGDYFQAPWFRIDHNPPEDIRWVRYWDLAGTKKRRSDDSAGVLLGVSDAEEWKGHVWVGHVTSQRGRPHETAKRMQRTAQLDSPLVPIYVEQEVGAGGSFMVDQLQRNELRGFSVTGVPVRGAGTKEERAKPASSAAEKGHVHLLAGPWNRRFTSQLEAFPDGPHDDIVDAFTGAFAKVQGTALYYRSV